jgi:phage terminase large subunit GpA-like protein
VTSTARQVLDRAWRAAWAIEPQFTVSTWAAARMVLTSRSSGEPGRMDPSRFPFVIEIMDALSDDDPRWRVAWMASRQVAKTTVGLAWIGYVIDCAPGPMLMVQPSINMLKKVSRQRVSPMLDETPSLRGKVRPARSRDSSRTMFSVEFDDGLLLMANAGSSSALRSSPARYLFADEVNEYDTDVDGQGDALAIAEASTSNFRNRKAFIVGNPGIKGHSRVEKEYDRGDQRRYFVPCQRCGHMDIITWQGRDWFGGKTGTHHRITWDRDEDGKHLPMTAHMVCAECGGRTEEGEKTLMLERGEWRATAEGDGVTRSYQISSLYSPAGFLKWGEIATEFLSAVRDPTLLRAFVNNKLGEPWAERGEKAEAKDLAGRLEIYAGQVPTGVGVLVAGVDVQGDRLGYSVYGFGAGEEVWLIEWSELLGETSKDQVWGDLDLALLNREFRHENGRAMKIERVCVDAGFNAERVYRYCAARFGRGVYPVKGGRDLGKPLVGMATESNRYGVPLFPLCVDTGKYTIVKRLTILDPGPGFFHFPEGIDEEFFKQLTAERALYKWKAGRSVRVWEKVYDANHAFDQSVYALAAFFMLGPALIRSLADRAAACAKPPDEKPVAPAPKVEFPRALLRPRGRWVRGFRRS